MNLENISDFYLGLILFIAALLTISTCLIFIVKLLHSLLQVSFLLISIYIIFIRYNHITSSICLVFVAKLLHSLLQVSFFFISMYSIIINYNNIIILTYVSNFYTHFFKYPSFSHAVLSLSSVILNHHLNFFIFIGKLLHSFFQLSFFLITIYIIFINYINITIIIIIIIILIFIMFILLLLHLYHNHHHP